jgi:thiamine-monophosphate kinase
VTGTLGGSILGRHLKPEPRLAEAQQLVEMAEIHACMDISDGLSLDLYRMMRASGCGAEVTRGSIPVSDAAIELAKTSGRSPLTHALEDGEDFELLFSVSPVDYDIISNQWPGNMLARITAIGTVNNSGKIVMVNEDGSGEELTPTGYTHNW